MGRLFIYDEAKTDPRSKITVAKMASISDVVAPRPDFVRQSGENSVTIDEGVVITVGKVAVFETEATVLNAANLDSGSAFAFGKDYCIYVCDTGNNEEDAKFVISLNSTYPTGYTALNSRKIGGFHYGQVRKVNAKGNPINASGVEKGAGWEANVYTGIVPNSVWTVYHRPKCDPSGMVYLGHGLWGDIYLSSDNGADGLQSAYNKAPITGTEGLNWYYAVQKAMRSGKRLPNYAEFIEGAFGSPGGLADSNDNAWTATTNSGRHATGTIPYATSAKNIRDLVGNVWKWLDEIITRAEHTVISGSGTFPAYEDGRANVAYTSGNGHGTTGAWNWDTVSPFPEGEGNIYEYYDRSIAALIGGGVWSLGAQAGARAVDCYYCPWNVSTAFGAWCVCDAL